MSSTELVRRVGNRPAFVSTTGLVLAPSAFVTFGFTEAYVTGTVCVAVHDDYFIRTKASYKRLIAAAVDKRRVMWDYHQWKREESKWYKSLGLTPPGGVGTAFSHELSGRLLLPSKVPVKPGPAPKFRMADCHPSRPHAGRGMCERCLRTDNKRRQRQRGPAGPTRQEIARKAAQARWSRS